MIATLSTFASQFDSAHVEQARQLFKSGAVTSLKENGYVWNADVNGVKKIKVSVRAEDGFVTDVFCLCKPGVCQHTIAVMFAIQKKLKINTEIFKPDLLENDPIFNIGPRINDIIYSSRQVGGKNGELEELGARITLKKLDAPKMRSMIQNQLGGYDNTPVFTGAKKLIGAAILAFEDEEFEDVFMVAKTVLYEISVYEISTNSSVECCRASVALMKELYNYKDVPSSLKDKIFNWVYAALDKDLYYYFRKELVVAITSSLHTKEQSENILERLQPSHIGFIKERTTTEAIRRLLGFLGREEEAKQARYENMSIYRDELVKEAIAAKDYAEVKRLARAGTQDKNAAAQCWDWIHEVAKMENDVPAMREFYNYKYLNASHDNDYYDALRASYSPEEWSSVYPELAAQFEQNPIPQTTEILALAYIYTREGIADRLASLLNRFPSYPLACVAQPLLEKKYADILRPILRDKFISLSEMSTTRDRTAVLRTELKLCNRTPWGKRFVNEIKKELIGLHPTWKTFQDELSKRL